MLKRERKDFIINTSKEYSIVSPFTSFVAIEVREEVGGACIEVWAEHSERVGGRVWKHEWMKYSTAHRHITKYTLVPLSFP